MLMGQERALMGYECVLTGQLAALMGDVSELISIETIGQIRPRVVVVPVSDPSTGYHLRILQ